MSNSQVLLEALLRNVLWCNKILERWHRKKYRGVREDYYEKFFDFLYIFCISNGTYQNAGQKLISTGPATGSSLRTHGDKKKKSFTTLSHVNDFSL